jgi:CBS domain containing-hemolysin-like protein
VLPGSAEIKAVNEAYGLSLDDSDYTTLGGVLFGTLGRLPKVGDIVTVPSSAAGGGSAGASFEITEMEGRRVGKARLVKKVPA